MYKHDITTRELGAASGFSHQYISHLRIIGRAEPTRRAMLWIAEAASYIVGHAVQVGDLFDLTVPIDHRVFVTRSIEAVRSKR